MDQSDEEDVGGSSILEMFDAVFMRKVMLNHGDALTNYFEACFFWIKVAHAEVVVAVWNPRQQIPFPFVLAKSGSIKTWQHVRNRCIHLMAKVLLELGCHPGMPSSYSFPGIPARPGASGRPGARRSAQNFGAAGGRLAIPAGAGWMVQLV